MEGMDSNEFECTFKTTGCFYKYEKQDKVTICPHSPCPVNLYKFGIHERIIEYYLDQDDFENAYYYFKNLLPQFQIDCDVSQLESIKQGKKDIETKDLPLGCRVFKISDELKKSMRLLRMYKEKQIDDVSKKGQSIFILEKTKFCKKLEGNLEILEHLAMDVKKKYHDEDRGYNMSMAFLDRTIELAKKYGDKAELPNIVENMFTKSAERAGILGKEDKQKRNLEKIKDAKMRALTKKMTKELKENGEVSEETIKEMERIQVED